jgi:hypothetical protein
MFKYSQVKQSNRHISLLSQTTALASLFALGFGATTFAAPPAPPVPLPNGTCLPINQPIPFTIRNGYDDSIEIVGGRIHSKALSPARQQELRDIQVDQINPDLHDVITLPGNTSTLTPSSLRPVAPGDDPVLTGVDNQPNARISVTVQTTNNGNGLTGDIHGVLFLHPSEIAMIAQSLPRTDPTGRTLAPQVSDYCVNSIAIAGHFDTLTPSIPSSPAIVSFGARVGNQIAPPAQPPQANFHATIQLYLNRGGYSFDVANTDRTIKQDSANTQFAELPDTQSNAAAF